VGRRSQIDQLLAGELARGQTQAKAAEAAGCSLATVKRRWAEPAFRELVRRIQTQQRQERDAALRYFWERGQAMLPLGLGALFTVLQDQTAPARDKLNATRVLFSQFAPPVPPPAPLIPSETDEAIAREIRQLQRLALAIAQAPPQRVARRQPTEPRDGPLVPPEEPVLVTPTPPPPPEPVRQAVPEPDPPQPVEEDQAEPEPAEDPQPPERPQPPLYEEGRRVRPHPRGKRRPAPASAASAGLSDEEAELRLLWQGIDPTSHGRR
jgi:hypothetical protein